MSLPRSGLGTTSLGAVGGARGTAAGTLRILVEFFTQYDSAEVKKLEADLARLSRQQYYDTATSLQQQKTLDAAAKRSLDLAKDRAQAINKLAGAPGSKTSVTRIKNELKQIEVQGVLTKAGQARLAQLDKLLGGHGVLLRILTEQANIERLGIRRTQTHLKLEEKRLQTAKGISAAQGPLDQLKGLKANVGPRLAGLAIGAVGGVFGGALLGVGFAAAQALLDQIEQSLLDVFDPARHARDAIKDLGEAINGLSSSEENAGDRTKAAIEYLNSLGIAADAATVALLAKAGAEAAGAKSNEELKKIVEAREHPEAVAKKNLEERISLLVREAEANGTVVKKLQSGGRSYELIANRAYYAAQASRELADAAAAEAIEIDKLTKAQQALAATAQLAAFAQTKLVNAIKEGGQIGIDKIQGQINAVENEGPSARTRALEKKIAGLSGGGGSGNGAALRNIAEERQLLLLRQKLNVMGAVINLEKYSGKFLLEAVNAKIKALDKQAAAQDRINKLLDLQFRASQVLRRNEGETISDFLERRAQENRDILSEGQKLEDEATKAHLEDIKDKTEIEVALIENAEKRKNALASSGTNVRLALLQKELAASKKKDAAETKAKLAALKLQQDAYKELSDIAGEYATITKNTQIREALSGATTIRELQKLSGEIAGLTAAKGFIKGLLQTGAVTGTKADLLVGALADIERSLGIYNRKLTGHLPGRGPTERDFATGGLIPLSNASSPFGSNVRFGEEGTEYGLVLQHSIAKTLRGQARTGQIGPFYVNKSNDWLRDKYALGKTVEEAIDKALR